MAEMLDKAHARAHGRVAHHLGKKPRLLARGIWYGRGGSPETHGEMLTHLWSIGGGRFIADHDYHRTLPRQTHQESHGAETAREIYDALPNKEQPFPGDKKAVAR